MLSVVQGLLLTTHAEVTSRFKAQSLQGQTSELPPWDVRLVLSYLRHKVAPWLQCSPPPLHPHLPPTLLIIVPNLSISYLYIPLSL